MKTVNKVILVGNLGRDVELRYSPAGEAKVVLSLATSSEWKDRESGEKQQSTEWHRCVAYRQVAELIGQFCKKGSTLYIEGKLRTRKWQDDSGADQYITEVVVEEFINMDKRASEAQSTGETDAPAPAQKRGKARKG